MSTRPSCQLGNMYARGRRGDVDVIQTGKRINQVMLPNIPSQTKSRHNYVSRNDTSVRWQNCSEARLFMQTNRNMNMPLTKCLNVVVDMSSHLAYA